MAKKKINQILGIILIIAAILMLVNIPFVDEKSISVLIVIGVGIYSLVRK